MVVGVISGVSRMLLRDLTSNTGFEMRETDEPVIRAMWKIVK